LSVILTTSLYGPPGKGLVAEITCAQFALYGGVAPAGWTVKENTCGYYTNDHLTPFASLGLTGAPGGPPGRWYYYTATVEDGRVIVPSSEIILPTTHTNVFCIIRRQEYSPTEPGIVRDFTVNNDDNSIDFIPSLSTLNGQSCSVKVFK
jgi:hypothetical protein